MNWNKDKNTNHPPREPYISIAPMMDWTDRHCRYFHRLISPNSWLFTEMVTTGAIIHGDRDRFLRFDKAEHPVALQLGGSDPAALAECAKIAADYGYDEVNLNCGCPSDRVQSGRFGACLMAEPDLVADCVSAMNNAVSIPVTVKCRIGIDDCDEYSFLKKYIETVSAAGCKVFTVHARKAWLQGLSPKENRDIPPLRYDIVKQIKDEHPDLQIILNGGIKTIDEIKNALENFDGAMIGREAYQNPWLLAEIENEIFGNELSNSRLDIIEQMVPYGAEQFEKYGTPVKSITRHMLGLFKDQRGAKQWKRYLSENAFKDNANHNVMLDALNVIGQNAKKAA